MSYGQAFIQSLTAPQIASLTTGQMQDVDAADASYFAATQFAALADTSLTTFSHRCLSLSTCAGLRVLGVLT